MSRQLKPMLMGAIFTLVAMGFAYALPHAVQLQPMGDDEASGETVVVECPEGEEEPDGPTGEEPSDGSEGEVVDGTEDDGTEDDGTEGDGTEGEVVQGDEEPLHDDCDEEEVVEEEVVEVEVVEGGDGDGEAKNHGQVVRVAAHCDVKGAAHGELVRSIAQDKGATVSDAEAACEKAIAAAEASADGERGGKPDKAEKGGKPENAGGGKHADDASGTDVEASSSGSEVETHGNGKDSAKGKSK